jgi:ribose transport system permease protein
MAESTTIPMTVAQEFSLRIKAEKRKDRMIALSPVIILVVLMAVFGIAVPEFLSLANLVTILSQLAIPLTLALGLTFVIMMGSIDLSVDGIMGLAGSAVSLLLLNNKTTYNLGLAGVLIALLIGVAAGLVTGTVHVKARLPSFMVSFGMTSIGAGLALLTYRAVPATIQDPVFMGLAVNAFLGIPYLTWIALGMFVVGWVLQQYTAFGRYVYAIGANEGIPRQMGINVDRIKILVFVWSGVCIALAGIMGAARLGIGQVTIGRGSLFPAITAVVVGGTPLSGGKGGVVNTLLGALIVTVLQNGLILLGVNPYIQSGIQGIIIVVAVAFTVTRSTKSISK